MVAGDKGLIATYDNNDLYTDHSLHLCVLKHALFGVKRTQVKVTAEEARFSKPYSPKYLLGLVNSQLMAYYFAKKLEGGLNIYPETVRQLAVHRINFDDAAEKQQHDAIVARVEEMLELQKEYAVAAREKLPRADTLKRKIDAVDAEIDAAVYRLYDLSVEEIRVVEGKTEESK